MTGHDAPVTCVAEAADAGVHRAHLAATFGATRRAEAIRLRRGAAVVGGHNDPLGGAHILVRRSADRDLRRLHRLRTVKGAAGPRLLALGGVGADGHFIVCFSAASVVRMGVNLIQGKERRRTCGEFGKIFNRHEIFARKAPKSCRN